MGCAVFRSPKGYEAVGSTHPGRVSNLLLAQSGKATVYETVNVGSNPTQYTNMRKCKVAAGVRGKHPNTILAREYGDQNTRKVGRF